MNVHRFSLQKHTFQEGFPCIWLTQMNWNSKMLSPTKTTPKRSTCEYISEWWNTLRSSGGDWSQMRSGLLVLQVLAPATLPQQEALTACSIQVSACVWVMLMTTCILSSTLPLNVGLFMYMVFCRRTRKQDNPKEKHLWTQQSSVSPFEVILMWFQWQCFFSSSLQNLSFTSIPKETHKWPHQWMVAHIEVIWRRLKSNVLWSPSSSCACACNTTPTRSTYCM